MHPSHEESRSFSHILGRSVLICAKCKCTDGDAKSKEECLLNPKTREEDDSIRMTCNSCGKTEYVSLASMENGDESWYYLPHWLDLEAMTGEGLCGGGPSCLP